VHVAASSRYVGPGKSWTAALIRRADVTRLAISWVIALVLALVLCGRAGLLALIPALVCALLLGLWSEHRLKGVNEGLLAAVGELTETAVLMFFALLAEWLVRFTGWAFMAAKIPSLARLWNFWI
jgi:cobalamin synthase